MMSAMTIRRIARAAAAAAATFAVVGTLTALWPNPLFARSTPAQGFEIAALAAQCGLIGLYLLVKRPTCSSRPVGLGALLGFFGVACPTCNKLLIVLLSTESLLTYVEPYRLQVTVAGMLVTAAAVGWEVREARRGAA
jgi:hypothetical protein